MQSFTEEDEDNILHSHNLCRIVSHRNMNVLDVASTIGVARHHQTSEGLYAIISLQIGLQFLMCLADLLNANVDKHSKTWRSNSCPTLPSFHSKNSLCERHGVVWKTHAGRLVNESSIHYVFFEAHGIEWLTAFVTWACNSASGYSSSQRAFGRGLRLPYSLVDQTGRVSLSLSSSTGHTRQTIW